MTYEVKETIDEITIRKEGFTVYFTREFTDTTTSEVDATMTQKGNRQREKFSDLSAEEKQFITAKSST